MLSSMDSSILYIPCTSPFEQSGFEKQFVRMDLFDTEELQDLFSVKESKDVAGTFVPETLADVGIDVVYDEVDVILHEPAEIRTLGNHIPEQFVIPFRRTLLPGSLRVTVKDSGTDLSGTAPVTFNLYRIGELTSVVCQNDGKKSGEQLMSQHPVQTVEYFNYRRRIIGIPQESQHEFRFDEMDRQQDFSALFTFHRVDLYDGSIRMRFHICFVILICSADPALLVDFEDTGLILSGTETDTAREVDASCLQDTAGKEAVKCALTGHDGIRVGCNDVIQGQTLLNQGRDEIVDLFDLFFRKRDSGVGFRPDINVFPLSGSGLVNMLFQRAEAALDTSVADIWGLLQKSTGLFYIVLAAAVAA